MDAVDIEKELLPLRAPHMQRQEAGAEAVRRHQHRRHDVRGRSQPSLWAANGGTGSSPEANSVSL